MDVGKIQSEIKRLEMEQARAEALREKAVTDLCELLNCEHDQIADSIEALKKRKDAGEKRIVAMEQKLFALIPEEYRAGMGL